MIDDFDNDYERNESLGFWTEVKAIFCGEMMFKALLLVATVLAAIFIGLCLTGCAPAPKPPTANGVVVPASVAPIVNHLIATSHPAVAAGVEALPGVIKGVTATPADLASVSHWTNFLVILGIIIFAAAVGVYFVETALQKIAIGFAAGGVALTSYSLFVHTTLWLAPYVSGGMLLVAIGLVIYETIRNRNQLNADVTSAITPTGKTAPFPELATKVKTVPVTVTPSTGSEIKTVVDDIKKDI